MVSPYLQRPIRTLKQAQKDRARGRRRSKPAKTTAKFMVHMLSSLVASTSGMPPAPTDREAA